MGDTRRRGRVIWFLMTSRPDLVPMDLKRQGRAEEHIALFPPATPAERATVFEQLRRRLRIPLAPGTNIETLLAAAAPTSPRRHRGILVRASRRMATSGATTVDAALLRELIADFQPPSYPLEIEYQRLIAAFECHESGAAPPSLARLSPAEIGAQLNELRAAMGANTVRRDGG